MVSGQVKDVLDRMPEIFNPDAAKGMDAVFQLDISGDGGGNWNAVIKDGTCSIQKGSHTNPTVRLTMSADTWLAMVNRETNGMQAFMDGRLKVSGDIMLAQRLEKLFRF
jgi:putative sterol carrier protein